ncbi:penicillin-binding protein 2 [Maridesulfovibrio salexigens]|uniref:Penicillin-binding protein 2 n=1 Tax=Maridesulfovibrio salexigens (strain ATCC 14822 / DSM 2638 / NCIMB 8403 / VKM B-1763) TaxID=526222 RepID=C6BSQ4_MARSD|nr:penicillin-binding protein 2 [Maridesulfovibrio salexigens]ACS81510.1 penicillin-binding protein 2 [Maridesulfovibrio salexigens DSM 2638]
MSLYESKSQQPPKNGLLLLQGLILLLFCIFALRFWYLQIHKGEYFSEQARNNQLRQDNLYAPRGLIRDRNGQLLAVNEPAYALGIVREDCKDLDATLVTVSKWTGVDLAKLQKVFKKSRRRVKPFEPLILVPNLTFEQVAVIEANSLHWPGLEVVVRPRRKYLQGPLLSHVLGYVSEVDEAELENDSDLAVGDYVGKQGLESVLEKRFRGVKGRRQSEVDATGRRLKERILNPPIAGEDIDLSIDLGLQELGGKLLEGKAGAVVVMNPDNGQILAFVSAPSYDNNAFTDGLSQKQWVALRDDPRTPLQNRVIQSVYPPGSVFKMTVAGAGLHYGMITPEDTVYCPGHMKLGKYVFRCWKRGGHGETDLEKSLVESCDVYYYKLGKKLGVDRMSEFAFAAGYGKPTGIALPHEKGGLIPTRKWKKRRFGEIWHPGENLNFSIGQGYTLVTPLQVARSISSLINGGRLLRPQLLAGEPAEEQGVIPLTDSQRELIRKAMIATVDKPRGTARRLRTKGVVVGGKTGTAQVVKLTDELKKMKDEDIPYKYRDHAWMASFAEKGDQRYVVVCMVEHGLHGGSGAGPIVKAIYDYIFKGNKGKK